MPEEKKSKENQNTEEIPVDWISDLSKISLLAEYMELAFREKCDCKVCQRLRERVQAFIQFTQKLPKL